MTKPIIGFIGPGLMGGNMVENLQTRGVTINVMDLNKDAVAKVIARGNANKDLGYFLEMVKDLDTVSQIAEGTSANLNTAVAADMDNGNVPEIFDHCLKLEK